MSLAPHCESKESPNKLLQDLLDSIRRYNPDADLSLVERAYCFSKSLHQGQTRSSGEQYIHHPLEVAKILAEYHLDTTTIATGLLHDTVEDTHTTIEEISKQFGPQIALLVDGLTKISKISFQTSEEKQAENFRKMILAMAQDLRVIIVKLADRLHNMRTLEYLKPSKQVRIAQETLDIYGPLANRLGLSSMKRELEDLGLRFTKPGVYYKLTTQVAKKLHERQQYIDDVQALITEAMSNHGYDHVEVRGRPKHFYSIHRKMEKRNLSYEQVFDIVGFRVIVESVEQCYAVLGLIHSIWTPVPGRFKDYVAIPKANFYQSLHTTVIGPGGEKIEVQIRTKQMHETAEHGIAAHWLYKDNIDKQDQEKFRWLNRLVEWNRDLKDPNEFLETVKADLFTEDVYVFTPRGLIMEFPQGATPLDFAYAVHTDVGNHCIGAKVDGRLVPLKHRLKSGDTVEILTSAHQRPNKDWLKIVQTSRARSKIRAYIKAEEHERSKAVGHMILERELKKVGAKLKQHIKDGLLLEIAESFSLHSVDDLLSSVGYGKITAGKILTKLSAKLGKVAAAQAAEREPAGPIQKIFEKAVQTNEARHSVTVKGIDDLLVRFARCCNPVPGDPVIGFITRGRGISVHTRKCTKIFDTDPNRLVEIDWDSTKQTEHKVKIRIVCEDRPGVLADMTKAIRDLNVNIANARITTLKDKKAVCIFTVTIPNVSVLRTIIGGLEATQGVIMAERVQRKR